MMAKEFAILLLSLLLSNSYMSVKTADISKTDHYDVISGLNHQHTAGDRQSSLLRIVKLREKRQASTDVKNQYESVSSANTTTTTTTTIAAAAASPGNLTSGSVMVPYNTGERPLLGVNGTGQRRDGGGGGDASPNLTVVDASMTPAMQPTVTQMGEDNLAAKKALPNQFPKKVAPTLLGTATANAPASAINQTAGLDDIIESVDVSENDTLTAIKNHNLDVNLTTDHHHYYNSSIYVNKVEADDMWSAIKDISPNTMLSQSHRRAMTVELKFDFPFYGHSVRNVTVATGGFLYTGEYVHSWLAATQYIAPLMANFDTSMSNASFVRLHDNGTAFTAIWENVSLQDKPTVGEFTFSATLHQNGDIVFTYFNVPLPISAIQNEYHPVKVGLSDAYIIDKVVYFARRKTIYEYHRVNFANSEIMNATIIRLTALSTCLEYNDCASCIQHETAFDCAWCPVLSRCSTGTDRKKQEWLTRGCDRTQITSLSACPAIGQKGNVANNNNGSSAANPTRSDTDSDPRVHSNSANEKHSGDDDDSDDDAALHPLHQADTNDAAITAVNQKPLSKASTAAEHGEPKSVGLAFGLLVPLCLIITILVWVLYAYRNPHTKSGQLLIQYRPAQWTWRRGEARYTAATIHM